MPTDPQDFPDLEQKFAPGELAASEGKPDTENWGSQRQDIPEQYQLVFSDLRKKIAARDQFARISEVKKATERRFYWRGDFDVVFNEQSNIWESSTTGVAVSGSADSDDSSDIDLHYPFNIFQAFGRGFITIVSQIPALKMEATTVDGPDALRISQAAEEMKTHVDQVNDMDVWMEDTSRLFWTDGRVGWYQRWVTDGARFGYEDHENDFDEEGNEGQAAEKQPRKPKGSSITSPFGVLELKVPMTASDQSEFMYMRAAKEIDITAAKAMYPWLAKKFKANEGASDGADQFERISRLACTQGLKLIAQSGDSVDQLPTWERIWIRPSFYVEIDNEENRNWFEDNYPEGAYVSYIGATYCESRNESMDDHWKVDRPLPGDGQSTPACGDIIVPVQDAVCDLTDLRMETYLKSIPAVYCDKETVDLESINKQKAGPGAHFPITPRDGQKAADAFWVEPAPALPADAIEFGKELFADIPQFLTGLYAAALGQADNSNETKGGIEVLRDQAKGQAGVAWRRLRKARAAVVTQLVRIEAYFKAAEAEDGQVKINETIIELEDLHDGNWKCVPDGDEAYPSTHSERKQAYGEFAAFVSKDEDGAKLLMRPKNLLLAKDLLGLGDLDVPEAAAGVKQLQEIKQLLNEPPIPNEETLQNYMQMVQLAQAQGQPAPPKPPDEALYQPSVPIDPDFDDHEAEDEELTSWVNGPKGQEQKRNNPQGFLNVRLHGLAHKNQLQKQQNGAMQQQIQMVGATEKAKMAAKPAKTPAESINFADLGPSGKIQVGAQAGLDLHADAAAELAGESMGEGEEKPEPGKPKKPN